MKLFTYIFILPILFSQSLFSQLQHRSYDLKSPALSINQEVLLANKMNSGNSSASLDFYRPSEAMIDSSLRHLYSYDNSGNTITDLYQYLSGSSWVNAFRESSTYDNSGNLLTKLTEDWINEMWVNSSRQNYTYDNNGNILTLILEHWESSHWNNFSRKTYTYDTGGNLVTELWAEWSTGIGWVNNNRLTYTYDNNGNETSMLWETWSDSTSWSNSLYYTYTYDNGENKITIVVQDWLNGNWVNLNRYNFTYGNNGKVQTTLWEKWSNGAWENDFIYTYTYNINLNLIIQRVENDINGTWVNYSKNVYYYDNGNAVRGESYSWENESWILENGSISIYYNNMNDYLMLIGKWADVTYDIFTDVNDFNQQEITYSLGNNYPNPFNPSTTISYSIPEYSKVVIKVFDILGNEIETVVNEEKPAGEYKLTWNASALPSGIYFYRLQAGRFIETKKMLLMK